MRQAGEQIKSGTEIFDEEFVKIEEVARTYLEDEDIAFLRTQLQHNDDRLAYVYLKLIENGEDPQEILKQFFQREVGNEV